MAHANKFLTNDDKPPGSLSIALKVKTLLGTSLKKERKEQNRTEQTTGDRKAKGVYRFLWELRFSETKMENISHSSFL